jgi:hypothetical protein
MPKLSFESERCAKQIASSVTTQRVYVDSLKTLLVEAGALNYGEN